MLLISHNRLVAGWGHWGLIYLQVCILPKHGKQMRIERIYHKIVGVHEDGPWHAALVMTA